MKIISDNEISEAALCIQNGGLVAFPTETVYGLGANALDPIAVARIFEAKKRPSFDPLIVHIANIEQIEALFEQPINHFVYELAAQFWPGPLTIVHKKSTLVPALVTSDLNEVAVRMPLHPIANKLIRLAGVPIAAPSANLFGKLSPTSYKHVVKQNMNIDYVIKDDENANCSVGIESTVVAIEANVCTILRPGVITANDIKMAIPALTIATPTNNIKLHSPGLLKSHYSPSKPLYFWNRNELLPSKSGLILHQRIAGEIKAKILYTSQTENLLEIASNLFSTLHKMEEDDDVAQIYIAKVSENGIGKAIMDRLKKATHQYKY
ncbi:MAG: threonylcarbamoyl-AMP synthase [Porphyromonadaceae bacterium CG2_30_38_12]|nr:MAG: threonylcarbamoyl-AMP synthase [Porphyromonadaceae bacterium CG2_30_38_12]